MMERRDYRWWCFWTEVDGMGEGCKAAAGCSRVDNCGLGVARAVDWIEWKARNGQWR